MTPQELKNSILQLAIQGKLVEQRSEEGTAEELYQQIQAEKQALIKAGKIKKEKPLPEITEDEKPFDIPESWKWVKFGEIVNYNMGKTPPRAEEQWWGNEFPWVSIADMPESGHIKSTKEAVSTIAIKEKFGEKISPAGTLIMSFKLTVGRVSILDIDAVHNEAIISIFPIVDNENTLQSYLFEILPLISQNGDSKDAIKGRTLNSTSINNLLIPLPPLAEQKRIVAKIEELLPLIDRYEEAWTKLEEFNKRFPGDMQKSLLQMAIQGKLVEQRPEEGTGEELYQKIQTEKQALIKSDKIKKDKPLPEIADDEKPFDIPESWKWVRWGEIVNIVSARRVHQSDWKSDGIPFYRAREIAKLAENGCVENELFISQDLFDEFSKSGVPQAGDLMVTAVGTLGKTYIVKSEDHFYYKDASVICFENFAGMLPEYLKYVMQSEMMKNQIKSNSDGTTVATLTMVRTVEYVLPLPPLDEQKRIVAKLEELLPLCERLK